MYYILLLTIIYSCSTHIHQAQIQTDNPKGQYEAKSKNFMVSSQGSSTSKAALEMINQGGNIIDAAIAASFAISVERPHSTGLGGGGFLLFFNANTQKRIAFDFREMAPLKSHSKMYLDKEGNQLKNKSRTGALSSGVPGLVAGLYTIHKDHGKLPWSKLLAPSIKLARNGMKIYPALAKALKYKASDLCKYKDSKKIFLNNDCSPKKEGEILIQSDLANTLELISKYGSAVFYKGEIAKKIVASQKKYNGKISMKDMQGYSVKKRKPIEGTYKDYKVISMPPPSSGGAHIIQILNILEELGLNTNKPQSAENIHLVASAMQAAFVDRARYMGDSDFAKIPLETLTSKQYAKKLAKNIPKDKALKASFYKLSDESLLKEPDHTTHFTIADNKGNIVASTQTINGWFGSSVVAAGTGIVMNNEMDDFASHVGGSNLFQAVGGRNNLVEPKKRPLSSMSPTVILDKNDKPVMALGTPSGTRILTCVMQTVLNYIDYKMPLWESVAATRIHQQWKPDVLRIGSPGFSSDTESKLKAMGHKLDHKDLGCKIQAISFEEGILHGVSDPREEGMSIGL